MCALVVQMQTGKSPEGKRSSRGEHPSGHWASVELWSENAFGFHFISTVC